LNFPFVVKKDGRREPYSKEKILHGLQAACQKRPISLSQLESVLDRISAWVVGRGEKEIPARLLGGKVMSELRLLDDVAYIRFASVYRQFKDVQEFMETLEDQANFEGFDPQSQLPLQSVAASPQQASSDKENENASPVERTRPADPVSN
jgi:transcriptional repressor NrdR